MNREDWKKGFSYNHVNLLQIINQPSFREGKKTPQMNNFVHLFCLETIEIPFLFQIKSTEKGQVSKGLFDQFGEVNSLRTHYFFITDDTRNYAIFVVMRVKYFLSTTFYKNTYMLRIVCVYPQQRECSPVSHPYFTFPFFRYLLPESLLLLIMHFLPLCIYSFHIVRNIYTHTTRLPFLEQNCYLLHMKLQNISL